MSEVEEKPKERPKVRVCFRMSVDFKQLLEELAALEGRSQTMVMYRALRLYANGTKIANKKAKR